MEEAAGDSLLMYPRSTQGSHSGGSVGVAGCCRLLAEASWSMTSDLYPC